jgi:hypothetical protein
MGLGILKSNPAGARAVIAGGQLGAELLKQHQEFSLKLLDNYYKLVDMAAKYEALGMPEIARMYQDEANFYRVYLEDGSVGPWVGMTYDTTKKAPGNIRKYQDKYITEIIDPHEDIDEAIADANRYIQYQNLGTAVKFMADKFDMDQSEVLGKLRDSKVTIRTKNREGKVIKVEMPFKEYLYKTKFGIPIDEQVDSTDVDDFWNNEVGKAVKRQQQSGCSGGSCPFSKKQKSSSNKQNQQNQPQSQPPTNPPNNQGTQSGGSTTYTSPPFYVTPGNLPPPLSYLTPDNPPPPPFPTNDNNQNQEDQSSTSGISNVSQDKFFSLLNKAIKNRLNEAQNLMANYGMNKYRIG